MGVDANNQSEKFACFSEYPDSVRFDMIKLTRFGGEVFILNADLIRYVEARPDTFITLISGDRVVVTESLDEVLRRAVTYQQAKHLIPPPASIAQHAHSSAIPQET